MPVAFPSRVAHDLGGHPAELKAADLDKGVLADLTGNTAREGMTIDIDQQKLPLTVRHNLSDDGGDDDDGDADGKGDDEDDDVAAATPN